MPPFLLRLWLGACLCLPGLIQAQNGLYPHFYASAGYGRSFSNRPNLPPYEEHILRLSAGLFRSPQWTAGLTYQRLWRYQSGTAQPPTYLIGLQVQRFAAPRSRHWRTYLELGAYQGNHCTCEGNQRRPFRRPGLLYAGGGLGLQRRLFAYTWLQAGFSTHLILTRRALIAPLYGLNYFHLSLLLRGQDVRR